MKKENYLEKVPKKNESIGWSEKDGIVTLEIENKGIVNRIFQKLLKKPKISYVHLDEVGSFVWPLVDGEKDIIELGKAVSAHLVIRRNRYTKDWLNIFRFWIATVL